MQAHDKSNMAAIRNPPSDTEDWRDKMRHGEHYWYMLEHGICTDCTFVVGPEDGETKQFKAHRFMLVSESPVFEKMLTGEMVEAKTGHVRVTDLSPEAFQLLLRFVYTVYTRDKIVIINFEGAREVAFAAHKYLMKSLLTKMVKSLCGLLSPENVWTAFEMADVLQQSQLRNACVEVLRVHCETLFTRENLMRISEDHMTLILQQDELNVEDELLLMNMVVYWARHEARRRGLTGDDEGVRAVLEPRLLSLLRFLALTVQQFLTGPALAGWLTNEEKDAILKCLQIEDYSPFPSHLSTARMRQKFSPRDDMSWEQVFSRPNAENQARSNASTAQFQIPVNIGSKAFNHGVHAKLVFRVKSPCKLMGFECLSRYRSAADPTAFATPIYEENILAVLYEMTSSLSTEFRAFEKSRREIRKRNTCYNSTMSIRFDEAVPLSPRCWFAIDVKLLVDSQEPALRAIQYENPVRTVNASPDHDVEFVFHTEQLEGYQTSHNDGLFVCLYFRKMER